MAEGATNEEAIWVEPTWAEVTAETQERAWAVEGLSEAEWVLAAKSAIADAGGKIRVPAFGNRVAKDFRRRTIWRLQLRLRRVHRRRRRRRRRVTQLRACWPLD